MSSSQANGLPSGSSESSGSSSAYGYLSLFSSAMEEVDGHSTASNTEATDQVLKRCAAQIFKAVKDAAPTFQKKNTRKINTTPKQNLKRTNLKRTISLLKEIISLNLSSKLLIHPEDMAEKERLKSTLVEKKEEFTTLCTTHAFHLALNEVRSQ